MAYHSKIHSSIAQIPRAQWQALLPDDNPFVSWDFLDALEKNHCIRADFGWTPAHIGLYQAGVLVGAMPCYLKENSHGEFVFDWAWARAYAQHRIAYYPKLLVASPYSPVTAPKLLARSIEHKQALIAALREQIDGEGYSSAHVNFITAADAEQLRNETWLARFDWQFHWHNQGWANFEEYLAAFERKKRKNIVQERRKVMAAGITIKSLHGAEISAELWQEIHALYVSTFEYKGNTPVLTVMFFIDYAARAPGQILATLAYAGDTLVAMALLLRSQNTLYGRYWGAAQDIPGLHFECCYYQGIEYCLRNNIQSFEPGAQGEHKLARGFLPTRTHSAHYLAHIDFRRAVGQSLREEGAHLNAYYQQLMLHSPFTAQS
jgi:uncharacterized protein